MSVETGHTTLPIGPFLINGIAPPDMPHYEILTEFGANYDSSMSAIRSAVQQTQRLKDVAGNLLQTKDVRHARKMLTDGRRRLMLDYFHVQVDANMFDEPHSHVDATRNAVIKSENGTRHEQPSDSI